MIIDYASKLCIQAAGELDRSSEGLYASDRIEEFASYT